jgi:hypothetical protein
MGVYKEELRLFENLVTMQGPIDEAPDKQGVYLPYVGSGQVAVLSKMNTAVNVPYIKQCLKALYGCKEYIIRKPTFWRWSFKIGFEYDGPYINGVALIVCWHKEQNGREWLEVNMKNERWKDRKVA